MFSLFGGVFFSYLCVFFFICVVFLCVRGFLFIHLVSFKNPIYKKIGTARQIFGTVPRLPVPRLPPGGSLGTPKIVSTVPNLACRFFLRV